MNKKVVLYSGGLDSFCLAHKVNPDVRLYFDLGLPENKKEIETIQQISAPGELIISDIFKLSEFKLENEVLPFRNLFLVTAAMYYGSEVYLGSTAADIIRDNNSIFAAKLTDLLKYISNDPNKNPEHLRSESIKIKTPFADKTKTQFVREYIENGGNVSLLLQTRSCYKDSDVECGECESCIKKFIAFTNNYLTTTFKKNPALLLQKRYDLVKEQNRPLVLHEIKSCLEKIK